MKFYSTRDRQKGALYSLKDAAFMGLAPDGGLFMPEIFPQADMDKVEALARDSFASMASYLTGLVFGDDIPQEDLDALVRDAYDFPVPLVEVEPSKYTLQLFHGPTFAFKDFGGRFMGRALGWLNRGGQDIIVLTATSGDTGSAVAHGFWKVPGVKVVVLFPDGKVSDFQQAQMTSLGENIYPVAVNGCFDDCQRLVKDMFNDSSLRERVRITSANSINVLRWIPQSFYYFWGYCKWKEATRSYKAPDIVVPSGNWGNITAGMLAWKMGLPVSRFISGSNANDVVPRFLAGETYAPCASVRTVANAMDVGAPSNFERLMDFFGGDEAAVRSSVFGKGFSDGQIMAEIKRLYDTAGYESDPHSAVGSLTYDAFAAKGFYLSTAHSAKFEQVLRQSIGKQPSIPEEFARIKALERKFDRIPSPDARLLSEYIEGQIHVKIQ